MIDSSKNDRDRTGRPDRPKFTGKPGRGKAEAPPVQQAKKPDEAQRIAKVMARAGLCSRRDAEGWISQGRVDVNGITLTSPAFNVQPGDKISVDGVALAQREPTRLFAFHKPRGFVTTDRDPEGRPTIFDHLGTVTLIGSEKPLPRTVTIGRLDINTEGLLLLTNDGGLARVLELPSTGWLRRYRVRANGTTDQAVLDGLRDGVMIDGIDYLGIEATLDRVQGANLWLTMGLREGKNREIKRVLEHIGLAVTRLIRISFGPFQLAELGEGEVEEIKTRILRDQLGPNLIAEAGCDFDSPPLAETAAPGRGKPQASGPVPRDRPEAGPRKHVSTLRAERDDKQQRGARPRIESSATEDRKGRAVKVERVVASRSRPDAPVSRNARRFAGEGEARPARDEARPAKKHFRGGASDGRDARPPRGEERSEKRFARPRPGGTLVDGPQDRPARTYGKDRPRGDGPARDDRPARPGPGRERAEAASGSFKGARRFSASGKPFSDRPGPARGGKPQGEPSGDGKPFGGKPRGAKPAGGKPFRAAPDGTRPGGKPGGRPAGPRPPRRPG